MLDVFSQVVAKSSNPTAVFTSLNDGGYTVRITDASGYTVDEAIVIEAGQVVEVSIALTGGTFYYTTDVIEASVAQPISGMTYECFKKPESASGFIIYQNPTRDILNVQINQKKGFNKLSIFDASGRLIHT